MLGTGVFVLVTLVVKYELEKQRMDPVAGTLAVVAAVYGMA